MYRTIVALLGLLLAAQVSVAQSKKKPLSDNMLDQITAAGVTATMNQGVISFSGEVPTANGLVTGTGSLIFQNIPYSSTNLSTITLSGNAQQNLSSLVNIVALNSTINVLLNLNININSTIGTVTQSNLNGKP